MKDCYVFVSLTDQDTAEGSALCRWTAKNTVSLSDWYSTAITPPLVVLIQQILNVSLNILMMCSSFIRLNLAILVGVNLPVH